MSRPVPPLPLRSAPVATATPPVPPRVTVADTAARYAATRRMARANAAFVALLTPRPAPARYRRTPITPATR